MTLVDASFPVGAVRLFPARATLSRVVIVNYLLHQVEMPYTFDMNEKVISSSVAG
jgi:hypothetical protein